MTIKALGKEGKTKEREHEKDLKEKVTKGPHTKAGAEKMIE